MTHLFVLSPDSASEADLAWIDKLASFSYYEETTEDLMKRWVDGELQFLRAKNNQGLDGIIAVRVIQRISLRDYWIEFLAGRGFLAFAEEIHQELWERARLANCTRITGIAQHRGLARIYERLLKVKPSATIFSEEYHGQDRHPNN